MSLDLSVFAIWAYLVVAGVLAFALGYAVAALRKEREKRVAVDDARRDATRRQRSVVGGQIAEVLRPYVGDFPFDPSDLTFIGDPVDFIAFKGRAVRQIEEIAFVEVKSGTSGLSQVQRQVRDAIQAGRVCWVEARFPQRAPA
jgi:predicted Holliday junction resolvase-like endonuclease